MKKTAKNPEEVTNQNGQETAVILDQNTQEAISRANEKAEKLTKSTIKEMKRTKNIVPQYYEFETDGDTLRAFFLGVDSVTMNDRANVGEKKLVKTAFFSNPEGNFICSSMSLVKYLEQYGDPGQPYEIVYIGEEKTSKGNKVKTFDIYLLG